MEYTMSNFTFGHILVDLNGDKWFFTKKSEEGIEEPIILHMNKGIIEELSVEEFKENFSFDLKAKNEWHRDMMGVILPHCYRTTLIDRPLLNESEFNYLKSFLKPFRNRDIKVCVFKTIDFIAKNEVALLIKLGDDCNDRTIILPNFQNGAMYKNLVLDRYYTLEELGITYE